MKRIEDYDKVLPVLEVYRCVQSEGSRFGRPTIAVRTTGCTHRCYFGEGGWCDSWYTSIHPEKGTFTFNDIIKIYDENPQVKEMMLTGGSPTMHPALVNEITHFAHERGILVTIETEGSHFLETDYPLDLISLSPKFSNSVPVLGAITPNGAVTDDDNAISIFLKPIRRIPGEIESAAGDGDPDVIVLACSQYGQRQLLKDLLNKINGTPHDDGFITLFDGYLDKPTSAPTSDIGATGLTIVAAQAAAD